MQTTAKGERKVLNQYITLYQEILEFSLEKVWLEVIIKFNKQDADNMIDDVNARLIEVCDEYLQTHNLPLDKFQLATICMDLHSQAISSLDAPFKVIAKESKALVQEYLEKNKSKRETLERIKNENEALEKELIERKKEQQRLASERRVSPSTKVDFVEKPEMPSENAKTGSQGKQPPMPKAQPKRRWTDALAIDNFILPR